MPQDARYAASPLAAPSSLELPVLSEGGRELGGRVAADPDVEDGVIEHPVPARRAPVPAVLGAEWKPDLLGGAGREREAPEALELADGSGRGAVALVEVQLDDVGGFAV